MPDELFKLELTFDNVYILAFIVDREDFCVMDRVGVALGEGGGRGADMGGGGGVAAAGGGGGGAGEARP